LGEGYAGLSSNMATAFDDAKRRKRGSLTSPHDVAMEDGVRGKSWKHIHMRENEGSSNSSEDLRTEPSVAQEVGGCIPLWFWADGRRDASKMKRSVFINLPGRDRVMRTQCLL